MNQRSADPKVQAARLVRRRPMFASKSALQPTVTWVNTDCAPIRWSYRFFWEVTERGNIPFVGCPGTKLGFQSMKNRNIIMVMIMMILIIDSLHVSGWCVQHCCLSIRSPWTQLKRLHLRKTFSVTSNADIVHRFHFATDLEFDAGWIVRHWNPWLVLVLILVHIIVLDEGGSGKMCEAWKMLNLST